MSVRTVRRQAFRLLRAVELRIRPGPRSGEPVLPIVDAHNHLGRDFAGMGAYFAGHWPSRPVEELLEVLDASAVEMVINLDGGWGQQLRTEIARYQERHPDRFAIFCGPDYANFGLDPRFGETEARRLRESVEMGARGLKIWKLLGLRSRDQRGRLIPVDDPRLDPLWDTAAELRVPVVIHVGDPPAYFRPLDETNERKGELEAHPDWHVYPSRPPGMLGHPGFPTFAELLDQFVALLVRHPATIFVGAHMGGNVEDLGWVAQVLDRCPNFFVDTAARLTELGRRPQAARDFFIRYQDRILFGMDLPPDPNLYRAHRRFFETAQASLTYHSSGMPEHGSWLARGLALPSEVLAKVYSGNARRLLLAG
jgi:predicted TIM-barrel fold metal-dependent hydrolase